MDIRTIAAAISGPLGAPNNITISNDSSTGFNGNTAGIVFYSTGSFARYINGVPIVVSTWITPQTNFSQYEIRATLVSGDSLTLGTVDTWQSLASSRFYTLSTASVEAQVSNQLLIEIRWTEDNEVKDSATYILSAHGPNA